MGLLIASTAERVSAQGLLGVSQHGSEISESEPLRVTVTGEAGYDSNSNTAPGNDKVDSYFAGGGLGVFYAFANDRTRLDLGGNLTALYYDQTATDDNVFYNGRFTANLGHRISRRLEVTNNGMIAYEIEPDAEKLLSVLVPKAVETEVYRALLENQAGEHAARMAAMESATRNTEELIDSLTLQFNRARQASITKELVEIVSGAEAL